MSPLRPPRIALFYRSPIHHLPLGRLHCTAAAAAAAAAAAPAAAAAAAAAGSAADAEANRTFAFLRCAVLAVCPRGGCAHARSSHWLLAPARDTGAKQRTQAQSWRSAHTPSAGAANFNVGLTTVAAATHHALFGTDSGSAALEALLAKCDAVHAINKDGEELSAAVKELRARTDNARESLVAAVLADAQQQHTRFQRRVAVFNWLMVELRARIAEAFSPDHVR